MGTRWRGLLAPVNQPTDDRRRFKAFTHRVLPLGLKWQRQDRPAHEDAVVVGSLEAVNIGTLAEAVKNDWISKEQAEKAGIDPSAQGVWGSGALFDDVDAATMPRLAEDVAEAKHMLMERVVAPSVDPIPQGAMFMVEPGQDEPVTDERFNEMIEQAMESGVEPVLELLFEEGLIGAATLVVTPAFSECRPFELLAPALTAAVRSTGWSDLPIADQGREWDASAAEGRLAADCGIGDDGDEDWACYARAFLHVDDDADAESKAAYGFQLADLVDGELTIVPRAVFAAASVLQGGRGGTTVSEAEQESMRSVLSGIYRRLDMEPPWADEAASRAAVVAALTAAAPTVPAAWFDDPALSEVTPLTVTDDGRIFGHAAAWGTCHAEFKDVCVAAPHSVAGYAHFHRHAVDTDGGVLAAGRLTTGHGKLGTGCTCCRGKDDHACTRAGLTAATAHYDRARTLAWVRAGEDEHGIWIAGALATDLDDADRAVLSRRLVSGDWRDAGGSLELVEVLALATERPGFPLPRTSLSAGRPRALVAAGAVRPSPLPQSAPRLALDYPRLAREVAAALAAQNAAAALSAVPVTEPDPTPEPEPDVDGQRAEQVAALAAEIEQKAAEDRARQVAALADELAGV